MKAQFVLKIRGVVHLDARGGCGDVCGFTDAWKNCAWAFRFVLPFRCEGVKKVTAKYMLTMTQTLKLAPT